MDVGVTHSEVVPARRESLSVAPALAGRCCAEERLLTIDPPWAAGLSGWYGGV